VSVSGIPFLKGHGTENDFVLLPDLAGTLQITPGQVRALCDRHGGLGADGIIRIAPGDDGAYFMDYRNADGSVAEMCGNGARLFARYLFTSGLESVGTFEFQTRGGMRTAQMRGDVGDVSIGMGPVRVGAPAVAVVGGVGFAGLAVDVGNPHLVCVTDSNLSELDLTRAPDVDSERFPAGVNVEFVNVHGPVAVRMRVHERGVGETRSCGTGTVAAAAVYLHSIRPDEHGDLDGTVTVQVPGGSVRVDITAGSATLTGPAVIVATGIIDADFWVAAR